VPTESADGRVARVLHSVRVVQVAQPGLAGSGVDRQVLVAVDAAGEVATALARLARARPVLVRVDD
jgi:hypothetical protein